MLLSFFAERTLHQSNKIWCSGSNKSSVQWLPKKFDTWMMVSFACLLGQTIGVCQTSVHANALAIAHLPCAQLWLLSSTETWMGVLFLLGQPDHWRAPHCQAAWPNHWRASPAASWMWPPRTMWDSFSGLLVKLLSKFSTKSTNPKPLFFVCPNFQTNLLVAACHLTGVDWCLFDRRFNWRIAAKLIQLTNLILTH